MMKIRKYKIECKKCQNKLVTRISVSHMVLTGVCFDISKTYTNRKACQANTRQTTFKWCVNSLRLKKRIQGKNIWRLKRTLHNNNRINKLK